ncbi:LUD domain-containing protein [Chryseolinea sp. H1M3-3]|uniref:LutC/YkgG family protein n=1 Tax=Chryseolinea sp. H1M3-3 TaxID=3034144 RepID=UPI0023EC6998|nr:LUD domain-containing protein [Chryseolinea sp. H1M3-3]
MASREKILENILRNQPPQKTLPDLSKAAIGAGDYFNDFKSILEKIGGAVIEITTLESINEYVQKHYSSTNRIVTTIAELPWFNSDLSDNAHSFEDVDLAVLRGHFGVAENGAVWVTNELMGDRAIPFIAQHLALVIHKRDIVPSLHEVYEKIDPSYDYGTFIAGPSKTADIEQSLVLGAHGPKSMVVFVLAT